MLYLLQGQILFCWTDDRNDRDTVKYLKSLGISGIIYDRMDQHNSKEVSIKLTIMDQKGKILQDASHI
jgi:glycerophosphocholine phosphodiesterase GPCPD1